MRRAVVALLLLALAVAGAPPASSGVLGPGLSMPRHARAIRPVQDSAVADLQVRLDRMAQELSTLTGRLEEAEYRERRLQGRFDQLVGALDARLRDLEGGAPPAGVAASSGSSASAEPDPSALPPPSASPRAAGPGVLGTIDPSAVPPPPSGAVPETETAALGPPGSGYDNALGLLRAGDYDAAERALDRFVAANPDDPLAPNAAYWSAESLYVRGDYAAAAAAFGRNFSAYGPDAPKATDNLLKLGMALGQIGEAEKACRTFTELSRVYPDAPAHIRQAVGREQGRLGCG